MVNLKSTLSALVCAVAILFVGPQTAAVAQEDPVYDRIMSEGTLRVFSLIGALPQAYRDQNEFKGFDADFYRYVGEKLGVQIEPVWGQSAAMVTTLTSGRADVAIAYYRTPEREAVLDFTIPYKWVGDTIVVHQDDDSIQTVEDLSTKTIGVNRGSTHEVAARQMMDSGLINEVKTYDQIDLVYQDLLARRVDALMTQTIYYEWAVRQNPDLRSRIAFDVDPIYFGRDGPNPSQFPVVKGAPKLRSALDEIITEMFENGELRRIFESYGINDPSVWTPPAN